MAEIDRDIQRTILPTWLAATPIKFGTSDHGTLKADEWRTVGLVRLCITLPRVWTHVDERHNQMLDNFIHLITAITIGNARQIVLSSQDLPNVEYTTAELYQYHLSSYLRGVVDLFPTAVIKPNMHLCYHAGDIFPLFGPVHSWRTNVCERYIGLLQNIPMNMRLGEPFDNKSTLKLKHLFRSA